MFPFYTSIKLVDIIIAGHMTSLLKLEHVRRRKAFIQSFVAWDKPEQPINCQQAQQVWYFTYKLHNCPKCSFVLFTKIEHLTDWSPYCKLYSHIMQDIQLRLSMKFMVTMLQTKSLKPEILKSCFLLRNSSKFCLCCQVIHHKVWW